ncbi:MAG: exodeoxyribonuclease I [Pseudomonadales bacterium]|nr:exodeoxyribonuclease I [Pseudomonadales bacterium]
MHNTHDSVWPGSGGRQPSFYWYDLETSGIHAKWDRIVQFAAIRTNSELIEIGDESSFYVKLPMDILPDPEACLVTGLTPDKLAELGIDEIEALERIHAAFSTSQTCVVGYNNLRFDDEFIRFSFYRNFIDPYAREWQNRNSRWDIIDLARATAALRPQGIEWPRVAASVDGVCREGDKSEISFRLEHLSTANNLVHDSAHEALSDVRATIQLARLIKNHQPKLFDYYLNLRSKHRVLDLLLPFGEKAYVHVSGMYPRRRHSIAPIMSICRGADANSIIVLDLLSDYELLNNTSVEELRILLFSKHDGARPGLKEIKVNRCPFIAPINVLRQDDQERLEIDITDIEQRRLRILKRPSLMTKIGRVYESRNFSSETDVEAQLYEGGFLNEHDKSKCRDIWDILQKDYSQNQNIENTLSTISFEDSRMSELLVHFRARREFEMLREPDKNFWREYVRSKILPLNSNNSGRSRALALTEFSDRIKYLSSETTVVRDRSILDRLMKHSKNVESWLELL